MERGLAASRWVSHCSTFSAPITHVAFRKDGTLVSVTSDDHRLWNVATQNDEKVRYPSYSPKYQMVLNADGEVLAGQFSTVTV